jgi:glycosyltransferase involved in cell wall biosynthesis
MCSVGTSGSVARVQYLPWDTERTRWAPRGAILLSRTWCGLDGIMRILHVIDRLGTSGTETSLRELLPALEDGHLHHGVVTFSSGGPPPDRFSELGIQVFAPESAIHGRLARIKHVQRAVHDFRPDLLHTALFEADLAGRVAGRLSRKPVLSSLVNTSYVPEAWPHGRSERLKFAGVKAIDAFLGRRATYAFHAVTQAVADRMVADLGIDPSRIWVVPRGRSLQRLGEPSSVRRDAVRGRLRLSAETSVILNVGRHEPQKGQNDLLTAMSSLRGAHPDLCLLIAGREGRSTPELHRRIRDEGLEDVVRLLGARDDIGDLLSAADVFAFPSRYEGIGGAMLEAMLMGVPVVASDLPGLHEVLDDGRWGVLVPVADPRELATAIHQALADPEEASRRAAMARRRALEVYSFDASVEGMRSMYLELGAEIEASISGRRGRRAGSRPAHRALRSGARRARPRA